MPAVSIIVPVYKAEAYLSRCVESILSQSFSDFELILIDDGSPDNSGPLCDEYAARDSRIQVIHQENRGAAAARNAGLDIARGKYIAFCDSDDVVAPKWLEHLHAHAAPDTLPMCGYCANSADLGQEAALPKIGRELHLVSDYFLFNHAGIAGFLWNALYCGDVIRANDLRLRTQHAKGDYNEDLLFTLTYVRYVEKIVYTGWADYLYDAREGSLSRSHYVHYFDKYEEKYRLWRQFLADHSLEEQKQSLATSILYRFLTALNHADLSQVKRIISSAAVQEAVRIADTSAENPRIIHLIREKAALPLWLRLRIHDMKGRFL